MIILNSRACKLQNIAGPCQLVLVMSYSTARLPGQASSSSVRTSCSRSGLLRSTAAGGCAHHAATQAGGYGDGGQTLVLGLPMELDTTRQYE